MVLYEWDVRIIIPVRKPVKLTFVRSSRGMSASGPLWTVSTSFRSWPRVAGHPPSMGHRSGVAVWVPTLECRRSGASAWGPVARSFGRSMGGEGGRPNRPPRYTLRHFSGIPLVHPQGPATGRGLHCPMSAIRTCTRLVAVAWMALPLLASAACYQLFDQKNKLVLQSSTAPVDTSKPYSEEVARLYPGHSLIIGPSGPCREIDEVNRGSVKLPAQPLDRGPVRLSGDPAATQQRMTSPSPSPSPSRKAPTTQTAPTKPLPMFRNCKEARAAGAAPIRRGEPGFGPHLDKDGDGVACE